MSLRMQTETVHKVDCFDLEKFIKDVAGHEYETVPNEEWSNDSQHRFEISGELDEWDEARWENFKRTGKQESYALRAILNGMCSEKNIPSGTYLITVCW